MFSCFAGSGQVKIYYFSESPYCLSERNLAQAKIARISLCSLFEFYLKRESLA